MAKKRQFPRGMTLRLESLEPRVVLDAMPIITELMAAGGGEFTDGFGEVALFKPRSGDSM